MKNSLILALVLLLGLLPVNSMAAKKVEATKKKTPSTLGTSFKLDGSSLRGKYQSSMSTTATVENDKYMEDLLAGRKEFNDRLQQDSERN